MAHAVRLVIGVALATVALLRAATAAPAEYVGEAVCSGCHPAAQKAWARSAHARASAPALLGRRAKDPACLTCHATGEGGDRTRFLPGVQCEACHGAGAAYAAAADLMRDRPLARALGLKDLSKHPEVACARCHRDDLATRNRRFDYASAWKQIAH